MGNGGRDTVSNRGTDKNSKQKPHTMIKLGIMGDFDASNSTHIANNEALDHAARQFAKPFQYEWVGTDRIEPEFETIIRSYHGLLIAPGSPYKSMSGVLKIIEYARTHQIPTLGTCGGFQHMIIEFARNVLGITDAEHAETNPYASRLVINPLTCSLKGQTLDIEIIEKQSLVYSMFNTSTITENYYCNFGLNPEYQEQIHQAGFSVVASDKHKEARILELKDHPFYVATLFVPQVNSGYEKPHPILLALLNAMEKHSHVQIAQGVSS
jgi:CTP synthase (UTP-ammonia lyase)